MRNLLLIFLGLSLLILQAAFGTLVSTYSWTPNLLLPIVIYLGVLPDVHVVRGAAISFVLGYLLDSFCGSPMGLQTFILVSTFVVARFAGLRLFLRGPAFQIAMTFVIGVLAGGTILALSALFKLERPLPFAAESTWDTVRIMVVPAFTTALVAPLLFAVVRRIEGMSSRRRDDRAFT